MHRENITYTNFEGEKVTEPFYFNLTKAELVELELSVKGGWVSAVRRGIKDESNPEIVRAFKKLIMLAYGVKGDDGHFIKSHQLSEEFSHTEAYSELFMRLFSDADKASNFLNSVMPEVPEEARQEAEKEARKLLEANA